MSSPVTRIFSDLHYGDRGSRLKSLVSIMPLFEGADALVLNGDTFDTRPSRTPAFTAELRAETLGFFARTAPPTTFMTGNHDPDISSIHLLDLAGGRIFVTHGDIIFDDLVPWGQDAPLIRKRLATELARLSPTEREELVPRLAVYRQVAASIPQRHQSERNRVKYFASYFADTIWPPLRILRVVSAWRRAPGLAAALTRRYRPNAEFTIIGHIHHPGCWRQPNGVTVISTGSFAPPLGGWVVDVTSERLVARVIRQDGPEFRLGDVVADFPLTPVAVP